MSDDEKRERKREQKSERVFVIFFFTDVFEFFWVRLEDSLRGFFSETVYIFLSFDFSDKNEREEEMNEDNETWRRRKKFFFL
jgi:hypothetical protein